MIDTAPTSGDAFATHRDRLFGIAYRMTGSVADAEDLCQEAWLRWNAVDPSAIRSAEAYLVTITTRLAMDRLRSASVRREQYVGPYLPEPLVGDPAEAAELADSLTFAFLVMLDELSPTERATFLLHDVFGYPFDDVAVAVDRSVEAVRQSASRARRKLGEDRPKAHAVPDERVARVLSGLLVAIGAGDIEGVMAHLAPDVVQLDDGGRLRRAARRPIIGPERVARLWVNLAKRTEPTRSMQVTEVNGTPGLVFFEHGKPFMVVAVDIGADGLIRRISCQLNPEKLHHLEV